MIINHIEHVEDLAYAGDSHTAIDILYSLTEAMFNKPQKHLEISTKYDGAPAIVFGLNPENDRFFLGTKSVFNKKTPRIIYKYEDIDEQYGHNAGLADKLRVLWPRLVKSYDDGLIPSEGVFQGDLMFTYSDIKIDDTMVQFTPNTITYCMNYNHEFMDNISTSEFGIVVHTAYYGKTMLEMQSGYKVPHSAFVKMHKICWIDPTLDIDNTPGLFLMEYAYVTSLLDKLDTMQKSIVGSAVIKRHSEMLKQFMNYCIKIGESNPSQEMYRVFLNAKKPELVAEYKDEHINHVFAIHHHLKSCKLILMQVLNSSSMFFHEINGRASEGEGYVIRYHGVPVKLVNRIEFSRANFANRKFKTNV